MDFSVLRNADHPICRNYSISTDNERIEAPWAAGLSSNCPEKTSYLALRNNSYGLRDKCPKVQRPLERSFKAKHHDPTEKLVSLLPWDPEGGAIARVMSWIKLLHLVYKANQDPLVVSKTGSTAG